MLFSGSNCDFCRYFHAHHDAVRCPCAVCWRRRCSGDNTSGAGRSSLPEPVAAVPTSMQLVCSGPADSAVATEAVREAEAAAAVHAGPCPHSAAPYHQCRGCVLKPYFVRQKAHWDGHAVVCDPNARQNAGFRCVATCRCRRATSRVKSPMPPTPRYAAHEVPIMGSLASLYIKS
ncbi:hypothetical protein GH5_02404 [Leishmania sp. Ghana 2012 LV757]|uniref:hypothetical protein n=1 Tax=Leishmania sp. Ghana 2012 LV757 TaxID=2803181 RepID=UPI001B4053BA|nr:hypothetical protein GH5_02404 [Leishmania sp. Ghana 2012 LV757]